MTHPIGTGGHRGIANISWVITAKRVKHGLETTEQSIVHMMINFGNVVPVV